MGTETMFLPILNYSPVLQEGYDSVHALIDG